MENKKIVVICSLTQKETCVKLVNLFKEKFGLDIYHPFLHQEGSLYHIQKEYLKAIDACDLVIAIPKELETMEGLKYTGKTVIKERFGESVSYEMAYARHIGKPVMIFGEMNVMGTL